MRTQMTPNYANLLMNNFEQNLFITQKNWIMTFGMVSFY